MRVLIIVVGLICAAYALPRHPRIVGGSPTTIEKYPFMAGIIGPHMSGSGIVYLQYCAGTLITSTSIVTAAHCFMTTSPTGISIRLGSTFSNSGGKLHLLSRITPHPEYDDPLILNDVAVIKLTVPAVFSNTIGTARIAGPRYVLPTNTLVIAVGWGYDEFTRNPLEILKHVEVNVIDHQICVDRYAYLKTLPETADMPDITPEMLCTGILDVGGKDACQGDSGGPIIHNKDVLVGIISWGHECAHPLYPGVNTRVSSFTDWIYENSIN